MTDKPTPEPVADTSDGVPWRSFYSEAVTRLASAGEDFAEIEARRIVEEASGCEPGEFALTLDDFATVRAVAHFDSMLERRLQGEPLQYVLGRWAFRSLDLAVDARVLIPRPETETVAGLALDELTRLQHRAGDRSLLAADLGTGSGCIGLSLVSEHLRLQMICTDISADALAAARANTAGLGRPAARVELREGSWFEALPVERLGEFDLIISNPPYIGDHEQLPAVVNDWEPRQALRSGPTGLEAAEILIAGAVAWLRSDGVLVLELGETQLEAAKQMAERAGYASIEVHRDLAGRDRALIARRR